MKNLVWAISILLISACSVVADDCQTVVANFLRQPSRMSYAALHDKQTGADGTCWAELKKDVDNLEKLYAYASRGDKWAIKTLIRHTGDLDGGNLEDAYRSLGESLDIKPAILLVEFKEHRMTENQFKQAVAMLPLTLTDDDRGKIAALKQRNKKIHSVKDASLKDQKALAVEIIEHRIARLTKQSQENNVRP